MSRLALKKLHKPIKIVATLAFKAGIQDTYSDTRPIPLRLIISVIYSTLDFKQSH